MRAYHDSRELKFRDPFGAVALGGAVSISIDTWDGEAESCELHVHVDHRDDLYIPMEKNWGRYTATLTPRTPDIYWYNFIFHFADGNICYYGPQEGRVGGIGDIYGWDRQCPMYQITAYIPRKVPEWYKNAVCYQIFPDRFFRGPDWKENALRVLSKPRHGTPKALIERWNTPVRYKRMASGRIKTWDFYGGTLSGIEEKLDYLAGMGITALYLNPIFEAASSHRYDTGDYTKIDGMLGDEESFKRLCREAEKRGISIILDGVFNHTGCDSVYFNKFGNYPDPGAYQGPASKYYDWFRFDDSPAGYECWWGIDDLPDVEEHNPAYKDYIYAGKDSVVRRWLRLGAKGWRLDVADELPDDFIEGIKTAIVEELGDEGFLLGEVWEDASNKSSYGQLRRYLLGTELDSVMNYPVRTGVLDFLTGAQPAWSLEETLRSLQEDYPPENFNACFNLMGSHDRPRVLTVLGGAPDPDSMTEAQRGEYKLSADQRNRAKGRFWLMALMQMTLPGVPCIYYGDEAGMEGYSDPFDRGTFPWGREDRDFATMYRNAINLRRSFPELADAGFEPFSSGDDIFGFYRFWEGEAIAVLVNRGYETRTVPIDMRGEDVTDILGGVRYELRDGRVDVTMWPMGSAILHFHKKVRLGMTMERGAGVLAHITSLPCAGGPGNIGAPAFDFVDRLAGAGQRYWQILPLNPTDAFGSPYAGASAFAANISLLPESREALWEEFRAFAPDTEFEKFRRDNESWLRPWSIFSALREKFHTARFSDWPEEFRRYDGMKAVDDPEVLEGAAFSEFCQFKFEKAWRALRDHAHERGVSIIGDMPMYVSADSCDVWARPGEFTVDENGRPTLAAGVPPAYNDAGQLWGNPLYNWDAMERDGYSWWMARIERMLDLYDYVRLDHFMGFESAWAVPAGSSPSEGHWIAGPGLKLFKKAFERFGLLPFVAEDLGNITPAIRALLSRCGFPGTDILQYQNASPMDGYWPPKEKIAYSGTHDNDTLVGFAETRYPHMQPLEAARILRRRLYESSADVVIAQLQDVLELDGSSRMNSPGTAGGNWRWQAENKDFEDAFERLLSDTKISDRS